MRARGVGAAAESVPGAATSCPADRFFADELADAELALTRHCMAFRTFNGSDVELAKLAECSEAMCATYFSNGRVTRLPDVRRVRDAEHDGHALVAMSMMNLADLCAEYK